MSEESKDVRYVRCPVCGSDMIAEWKDDLARCLNCGEVFVPML